MWSVLFLFSLLNGVSANTYGCPTNVTCIGEETCCSTNTGLWACCPIEEGLCCDDGLHCCSKGQKCLANGNCSSSTNEITLAYPLIESLKSVQCPDGSSCADGNTCCQLASGQYGCCPLVDAVCCSDHIHCCPSGHVCDVEHGKCHKKPSDPNSIPCPDGSECPDGETCCQLQSGDYGCCPLSDAVCCSDHLHCCPHGYRCDPEKGQCNQEISIPWLTKTAAFRREQQLTDVNENVDVDLVSINVRSEENGIITCPDALSLCPSTFTCCQAADLTWGCCPIENAVCCSDHTHCCPTHYKCDLHIFKCDHSIYGSIALFKKTKSLNSVSTIQCPDEKSYCPEDTTCCELANGVYGCCPYPDASCCSDKIHCCANGYSCDKSSARCVRHYDHLNITDIRSSVLTMKSLKKENFLPLKSVGNVQCPDQKSECPLNSTCCPNVQGNDIVGYSCCPYSKGVCCGSNGAVCCPNNYICDEKSLSCQLNDMKRVLREAPWDPNYNQCATSDVACSADQTCCRTFGSSDSEYACCDSAGAECCEDGKHCCPKGSRCDIHSRGCISQY